MSNLARRILRKSIGTMRSDCVHCSACHRTPVPGEFVHRLAPERVVCSLCLARVPEAQRAGATPERVHATERPLQVARRAARRALGRSNRQVAHEALPAASP